MFKRHFNWVLGVALAGVVAGHPLAYTIVAPHHGERAGLLALTGHSYWGAAVLAGIVFGLASLGVVVARHFRAGLYGASATLPGYLGLALRLSCLQLGIFTVVEALERMSAGQPVSSLMDADLLPVGLAIQLLIALVSSGLLRWLARAAEVLGSALKDAFVPDPDSVLVTTSVPILGSGRICDACRGRGPPPVFLLSH